MNSKPLKTLIGIILIYIPIVFLSGCIESELDEKRGIIRGRVETQGGLAIPQARLMVEKLGLETQSDGKGSYVLSLPLGSHSLKAEKDGYMRKQAELSIESGENSKELDFTLKARTSTAELELRLEPQQDSFTTEDKVSIKLLLINERSETAIIDGYEFSAVSASGSHVWSRTYLEGESNYLELPADSAMELDMDWAWYDDVPSISPGSSIDIGAKVYTSHEGQKAIEADKVSVELLPWQDQYQEVSFDTLIQGVESKIQERRTQVFRDESSWRSFWSQHDGGESEATSIDFRNKMIIAAVGEPLDSIYSHLAILALENSESSSSMICRITRLVPTGQDELGQEKMNNSPFHFIVSEKIEKPVEFIWENLDLEP